MSWLCRMCETENSDDLITCEVCDSVSPYIDRFDYEEIDPTRPTTIRWKAVGCDSVKLIYNGHTQNVSTLNAIRIIAKRDTKVTFCVCNEISDREYTFNVREHKPPKTKVRMITSEDQDFVEKIISDEEFNHFFKTEGEKSERFFDKLLTLSLNGRAYTYIIETIEGASVGIISCQIEIEEGKAIGFITYAVLEPYRGYGLATDALKEIRKITKQAGVDRLMMRINTLNKPSIRVAEKCGFKSNDKICDETLPHMVWWTYTFAEHIGKREMLAKKAMAAYRKGDVEKALQLYENAIKFKYQKGNSFTDALLQYRLSNVYSSLGRYGKAYTALKKAKELGYSDENLEQDLSWLESNLYKL